MIKYDYSIVRDEGDGPRRFAAGNIPTELPNLVYIEGPNSSGKSTLLHLLALGCHGIKNRQISVALREKMENLLYGDHQKITFNISIGNQDNKIELIARKDEKQKEIELRDGDGKLITPEQFNKRYKLIYDIPEDPTKRLSELTHEISIIQFRFRSQLEMIRSKILRVIREIKDAKDPQRIENNKNEQQELESKKAKADTDIASWEEELRNVRLYTNIKYFKVHQENCERLKRTIRDEEKEDKQNTKEVHVANAEYVRLKKERESCVNRIQELYCQISTILSDLFETGKVKNKSKLALWRDVNVREELMHPDLHETLKIEGQYFMSCLEEMLHKEGKSSGVKEAHIIKDLMGVLAHYSDPNYQIPGIELSIGRFIEILERERKKYEVIIVRSENIRKTVESLNEILEIRDKVVREINPELSKMVEKGNKVKTIKDDTEYFRMQKLKEQLKDFERKLEYYKGECYSMGFNEKAIDVLFCSQGLSVLSLSI